MKRLGAIVLAVGLVVGAVFLRGQLDDESGGGGGRDNEEPFRLRCATELAEVCAALAADNDDIVVTNEDPGATADRLAALPDDGQADGETVEFDAWLVDGPWAQIVADNRAFNGLDRAVLGEPSATLGRSPAVVVAQKSRQDELTSTCGGTITWKCIGEQAPGLRIGLPSPDRGDGLAVLAEATGSWFGTTDYSSGDFEDPGFTGWFDRLTDLSTQTRLGAQTPLARALAASGTFGVVGALESQSARLLRGRDSYVTTYPEPMVTSDVVLVPARGVDSGDALEELGTDKIAEYLTAQGWRVEGQDSAVGVDASVSLPDTSNMPSAGVLQALRDLW